MKAVTRICILCETWESGGIEAFLTNVISHMDLTGLEIDIVCARLGQSVFTSPLEARGVHFYSLSGSIRRLAENYRRFSALLTERHYDVVYLNAYQALSLQYLNMAQKVSVPVRIAHSHNTGLRKSIAKPLKLALHRWARRTYGDVMTHRWACSAPAARFLFGDASPWIFIPNGIDVESFRFDSAARVKVRADLEVEGKLVLGNVGRLCYQKNQSFLLDVFKEVQEQCPESALLLVGEGEDRPRLEERARVLGIEKDVIFFGTTDRVEQLYWAMDILVMPSLFEGLPVTGIEAQCTGLPCLLSQSITQECALTSDTVFLPLEKGAEAWGAQVLDMTTHKERSSCADIVAAAGFSIDETAARVREVWME